MVKELRYALRTLRKQPGFVFVAVCSLAIGIGANTAIYSFADALLLHPAPVWKPSEVVDVTAVVNGALGSPTSISYPNYVDLRDHNHTFNGLIASALVPFGLAPDRRTQPRMRLSEFVSGNFFEVLHLVPELGRGFEKREDEASGRDAVVVLSHEVWISDFAGDPHVIGRRVLLNGLDFTVVGVAPKTFTGLGAVKTAMYVPIAMAARVWEPSMLTDRSRAWVSVRGRLQPGASLATAQADVARITDNLRRSYPQANGTLRVKVESELQMRVEASPPNAVLIIMLGLLAMCVLLIACANVTGLLLSRSAARAREIAVRLAIGAGRSALVRQLFLENLLLSLAGGATGLAIGYLAVRFFNTIPMSAEVPLNFNARLDNRALFFTLSVSVASTLLFGVIPALRGTRLDLSSALKERAGTTSRRTRFWSRRVMVSGQVALSMLLLVVAAILLKGFNAEVEQGPGFRVDRLQMLSVETTLGHYGDEQRDHFYKALENELKTMPGVRSSTLAASVPMGDDTASLIVLPQGYSLQKNETPPSVSRNIVSPAFFDVFAIPLTAGRVFADQDNSKAPGVVIVNEQFAHHYWPNQDAIGKRVRIPGTPTRELRVVGVVKTSKYFWVSEAPMDFVYLPLAQNPTSGLSVIAESIGPDPASLTPQLEKMVNRLDPNLPISDVRTMRSLYTMRAVTTPHVLEEMVGALGALALTLSCVGLYGTVSYGVSRRTREFGVRLAVGARRGQVSRLVLKEALWMGFAGTAAGLALGFLAGETLRSQLLITFQPAGWALYTLVTAFLLLTVCAAGYLPAQRASRTDPVRALRDE